MKAKYIYISILSLGTVLTACGGGEVTNESLVELISKRDLLKAEVLVLNDQIAEMDTTKEDYTPIVTFEKLVIKDFVHKIEVQGGVESDKDALINAEASGTIRTIQKGSKPKIENCKHRYCH